MKFAPVLRKSAYDYAIGETKNTLKAGGYREYDSEDHVAGHLGELQDILAPVMPQQDRTLA